jgi:hypothetical protein
MCEPAFSSNPRVVTIGPKYRGQSIRRFLAMEKRGPPFIGAPWRKIFSPYPAFTDGAGRRQVIKVDRVQYEGAGQSAFDTVVKRLATVSAAMLGSGIERIEMLMGVFGNVCSGPSEEKH